MKKTADTQKRPLWRWSELSRGLLHHEVQGPDINGVGVDSRLIKKGQLFIALPGDPGPRFNPSYRSAVDGHSFVAQAAAAGAAGALVHQDADTLGVPARFPLLRVEDTYDGLWTLGQLARARLAGKAIAITGSSGKTTAKHFISAALNAYAPPGSFNNHIGVPLSLANTPAESRFAVYEVGTNHPGEIEPLARMVAPDVAVLLNVQSAHIENFTNWEALKKEKFSIFNGVRDKTNTVSDFSLNVQHGLTFGTDPRADACVTDLQGDRARIVLLGKSLSARIPGGGLHRATTVAATLLVSHLLQQDPLGACELPHELIPSGRGNILKVGHLTLIDDAYNANPDSMLAAIHSLRSARSSTPSPHQIALIGEMLELGDASEAGHLALAEPLKDIEQVFCVGAGTRKLADELGCPWYERASDALLLDVIAACHTDSTVLIKGSNRVFWAENFVQQLKEKLEAIDVSRVTN
ncbi:MAG: UDP-N-acetylmuramoyl-tripeptide--D-alanyl-D-alanine ligase [bacterium]